MISSVKNNFSLNLRVGGREGADDDEEKSLALIDCEPTPTCETPVCKYSMKKKIDKGWMKAWRAWKNIARACGMLVQAILRQPRILLRNHVSNQLGLSFLIQHSPHWCFYLSLANFVSHGDNLIPLGYRLILILQFNDEPCISYFL